MTLKVTLVLPAGIVTVAGTLAAEVAELFRVTFRPAAGAALEMVSVPVTAVEELPLTVDGDTEIETRVGAYTLSVACFELEPSVAVIVAVVSAETAIV